MSDAPSGYNTLTDSLGRREGNLTFARQGGGMLTPHTPGKWERRAATAIWVTVVSMLIASLVQGVTASPVVGQIAFALGVGSCLLLRAWSQGARWPIAAVRESRHKPATEKPQADHLRIRELERELDMPVSPVPGELAEAERLSELDRLLTHQLAKHAHLRSSLRQSWLTRGALVRELRQLEGRRN